MDRRYFLAAAAGLAVALPLKLQAAEPEFSPGSVGQYDPVSYFDAAGPVEGKAEFAMEWQGVAWRFANAGNLAAFKADPLKYAPQYGGYCAYAVSKGATAPGDAKVWKVVNGKLYLNLSTQVQSLWSADIPGNIAAADANWPKVRK